MKPVPLGRLLARSMKPRMASGWTVVGRHGRDNFALFPTPVKGGVAITGYWTPGAHHIADGP